MDTNSTVETLRQTFRPYQIATLFVGESAPVSGKFFYDGNTNFYRYVRQAFDGGDDFLREFKRRGFFLDDLVLIPVNGLSAKERRQMHRESIPSLAQRIASYKPRAVISVMESIHDVIGSAIAQSGLADIVHYRLPFPGQGHQAKFVAELRRIREMLPIANS